MTTPAIDRNIVDYNSAGNLYTLPSGPATDFSVALAWDVEKRPASTTVPFTPEGWRPCSPWTHSGTLMTRNRGTVRFALIERATGATVGGTEWRNGSFWSTYTPYPGIEPVPFGLVSEAETKALNRLKDQTIHLGNFLAEAKRSILMVGNRSYQIANQVADFQRKHKSLWEQVKRWQRGGLKRADWRCIPNAWLELQYGWKPLLSDIFGALQHLEKASRAEDLLFSVKATSKRYRLIEREINSIAGTSKVRTACSISHSARVKLWYKLNSPLLAELSSLGLLNPAEIVWEITRYSFVVDWFLPIGSWLSALTGDAGYSFKGGSCSVKSIAEERVVQTKWQPELPGDLFYRASGTPLEISGNIYRFERSCYSTSPVPGVYFKNPLSVTHMLNGLALLSQVFRR